MGQYYKPISIEKNEYLYSHSYGNGLKLMEHSWIGNYFVGAVMSLIKKGGRWYGDRIVWAGDYADDEPGREEGDNLYTIAGNEGMEIKPEETEAKELRYLKNLDTNQYVDLRKVTKAGAGTWNEGWQIHPLPLLTCEGNGRGGGDYHKKDYLVGLWARNRVVAQKTKPRSAKELIFDLTK